MIDDREFMREAACRGLDPEMWFPDQGDESLKRRRSSYNGPEARMAQRICQNCPVIVECRAYAAQTGSLYGIWGSTTPADRAREEGRPRKSS